MLGFHPLASLPLSSLPATSSLYSESPVLTAVGLGDGTVYLSWTLNPAVPVQGFLLRRSTVQFPVSAEQGTFVYQGTGFSFVDVNVVVGTRYFYSVFAIISQAPLIYVPYEPQASDDVIPARVRASLPLTVEYVPTPGELGTRVAIPWPHGRLVRVWGARQADGRRSDYDVWHLARGREVVAPVSGRVSEAGYDFLSLDTDTGVRVRMLGQITPSRALGERVETGEIVAASRGGEVKLQLIKLATGSHGLRSIRPSYLYLRTERRL